LHRSVARARVGRDTTARTLTPRYFLRPGVRSRSVSTTSRPDRTWARSRTKASYSVAIAPPTKSQTQRFPPFVDAPLHVGRIHRIERSAHRNIFGRPLRRPGGVERDR